MSATVPFTLSQKGNASLVSAVCRISYPALHTAKSIKNDNGSMSEPKFGASLIFNPADCGPIWQAIVAVARSKFPPMTLADGTLVDGEQMLLRGMLHTPLRQGSERPMDAAYVGMFFVNAGSKTRPQLVGPDGSTPLGPDAFIAGHYVRAFLGFFPFDKGVNKGVGIGLNGLQYVREGERIDGRADARTAFAQAGALSAEQIGVPPGTGYNGQPYGGQPGPAYAAPVAAPAPSWAAPGQPVAAPVYAAQPQPAPQPPAAPVYAPQPVPQGAPIGQVPGMPPMVAQPVRGPAVPPGVG